ncbi:hypothetical protein BGZ96_008860 [Linnemannia gamsii]|uniref:WD40 repeat-like protein n=1 Tax=Linnemannia gamsii TaxID=64522 RepID=A0ABQ7JYC8_9FUNG|nr:hypothetical protein BGZ96_008860 [Linnemannia gamsii]
MDIPGAASQPMEEASRKTKRPEGRDNESGDNTAGGSAGGAGDDDHSDNSMEEDGEEGDWETETSESEEEELEDDDDSDDSDDSYDDDELADYDINPNDPESIFYHLNNGSIDDIEQFGDDEVGGDDGSDAFEDDEDDSEGDDEEGDEDGEHGPELQDDDTKIEELSPRTRAIYRPLYLDEDNLSDFSGDEKYAPKEFISGNDGEGDQDMVDFTVHEENEEDEPEFYKVSTKIRELMLNLKKGRAERERKLRMQPGYQPQESPNYHQDSPMAPVVDDGLLPFSRELVDPAPFLHRLMVRGRGHPREVEYSPAVSNHFQCANSMVITPSTMGLWDDIFTIHLHSILRCGVLERNTLANYNRRTMARFAHEHPWADAATRKAVLRPYARPLRTVPATKFLDLYSYRFDQMPESEDYIRLEDLDDPICIASRYGYMAHGASSGSLVVYCTQCKEEPYEIDSTYLSSSEDDDGVMLNSLQIVRWNRYHRSRASQDDLKESILDQDSDDPLTDYDEEDGYPSKKSGQFDHFLVMAGNEGGLLIASLPDHTDAKRAHKDDLHHHHHHHHSTPEHHFKYRDDRTWIREGFKGAALNDAKASPNGRWIAAVGDSAQVWIIEVTHVPETEEQRIVREAREKEMDIEDLETDSEYATDDEMDEDVVVDGSAGDTGAAAVLDRPRGSKRSRGSEDSPSDNDCEATSGSQPKSPKPITTPRLLHRFSQPQELLVPQKVLFTAKHKKNRQPRGPDGVAGAGMSGNAFGAAKVSFQYIAWNATSTKFAHSSDSTSRVVVWSMPSREIVCCVDTGGPAYSIEFHPKLENLFAVANWYGFVHVVDVTGACVGDEDLVVSDTRYNGQAEQGGPGLAGCEGPHYEEKHDILMLSFRGAKDMRLRIFDGIRGLGWSTDGRYLYVSTLRRVLRYEVADGRVRVPSLFQLCARKVKEWKEREIHRVYTREKESSVKKAFGPLQEEWQYVPYPIKRKIFGDHFLMRSHNE